MRNLLPNKTAQITKLIDYLFQLALPDGSHNFQEDTAYFHLPALDNPRKTVFGISCFRQISTEQIVNKTDDITRSSVQKSVCVLSRLPLYGQIQVKMTLITEAYFREGDFTRLDLIHQTYDNLNSCLSDDMLHTQQLYVGLSARNFVYQFKQRSLVLFKLMLLEKKVLFFQSPVKDLCGFLLTLLSLHPGMLENGLDESARIVPADTPPSTSPVLEEIDEADEALEKQNNFDAEDKNKRLSAVSASSSMIESASVDIKGKLSGALGYITGYKEEDIEGEKSENGDEEAGTDGAEEAIPVPNFKTIASTPANEYGLPLNIFTCGNLCHPYLSLSYLDILTQPSIHGYLIGATNILFKQKKGIAEVVVDVAQDKYDIHDSVLKKALTLTTEDLRFIDNVIRHVTGENTDIFLDNVGWEGGDEWVRAQFRYYLVCLLRTTFSQKEDQMAHFNQSFITMWKQTNNYRSWMEWIKSSQKNIDVLEDVTVGHPFAGHLSVTDMKLHLSNTITNSESGKRVTQAVSNTGRAVAGSLTSAKGAFSSFITSFRQPQVREAVKEEEVRQATKVEEATEAKAERN